MIKRNDLPTDEGQNLSPKEMKSRRDVFLVMIAAVAAILLLQLFNLQIVNGERYRRLSTENYLRITPIAAPRGNVRDRNGKVLVTSRPSYSVYYWYLDKAKAEEALPRLTEILGLQLEDVQKKIAQYQGRYYEPVPIERDITPEQYTAIVEEAPNLPGVFIQPEPIRYYPGGMLGSTVLGYVAEITESQLRDPAYEDYKIGDIVGQQGIEAYYQEALHGEAGGYQVEVDYRGRPTGNVGPGTDPSPGNDLQLYMDSVLQQAAEDALRKAMEDYPSSRAGIAVVLDVKTGGVLAMASVPGFDPNKLVAGITQSELNRLLENQEWRFSNLATTGLYPPGSTFKIVSAIAALAENKTTATETFFDPGYHPNVPSLPCNKAGGHGAVDIVQALQVSCNTYFYEMGRRLGMDAMAKYATALGLGKKTGVDLFGENYGTVPSTEWKKKAYEEGRVAEPEVLYSENMMAAMGQVYHLETPIQMASVVQAVANNGVRMKPQIVQRILDPEGNVVQEFAPEVASTLEVDQSILDVVRRGLYSVTSLPGGTAYWAFYDLPVKVAGKTGTAENPLGENHAWFVGFGPYENPEIALAVVVDQGGGGSAVAAPVARAIFDAYFGNKPE
ncbi:MAG: penicillin-binding protein 2 [Bacillota bacterium]